MKEFVDKGSIQLLSKVGIHLETKLSKVLALQISNISFDSRQSLLLRTAVSLSCDEKMHELQRELSILIVHNDCINVERMKEFFQETSKQDDVSVKV